VADVYGKGVRPKTDAEAGPVATKLRNDRPVLRARALKAIEVLKAQAGKAPLDASRIGAVGFCWGGGMVNHLATRIAGLNAAVPFYGPQPSAADTANIKAALLIHYASEDPRINAAWPAWEEALKANKVRYEMHTYPNTQHGFHNDTTPRYDEAAAKLAWSRTLAHFKANLGA